MTFWYVLVLIVIRLKSSVLNVRMTDRQPWSVLIDILLFYGEGDRMVITNWVGLNDFKITSLYICGLKSIRFPVLRRVKTRLDFNPLTSSTFHVIRARLWKKYLTHKHNISANFNPIFTQNY